MEKNGTGTLGINNMNGDTHDEDKTCGLTDMNCLEGQEAKPHSLTNMNGDTSENEKTCGLTDMNCVGE